MVRYAGIVRESVVDGRGIRLVVFLQGCSHRCKGCHNAELLPPDGGYAVEEEWLGDLILDNLSPLHRGVTFSGGDPLEQSEALLRVIRYIRGKKPGLDIWVYTGFYYEEVCDWPVLGWIDALVDGPFLLARRDPRLAYRGSLNQRIIDVPRSLASGQVVLYALDPL